MDDDCSGEFALGKHHDIHTAFIKCYTINKKKLEPSILCVKMSSAFRGILSSSFQCYDQHKHIGRTQKVFLFLFTNTKLIIFYKNAVYPFMDNAVTRRLFNLLLQSYFLFSPDLCSFICKMKALEDMISGPSSGSGS